MMVFYDCADVQLSIGDIVEDVADGGLYVVRSWYRMDGLWLIELKDLSKSGVLVVDGYGAKMGDLRRV